jgi:23S rRNA (pseudouridine1915-N3)-methyltransferase
VQIVVLQIDKTQESYLEQGIQLYQKRVDKYVRFLIHTIHVPKAVRQRSTDEQKEAEEKLIARELKAGDYVVLLDEKGRRFSSRGFAGFLEKMMNAGTRRLVFVIGGPFGFSKSMIDQSTERISLSDMTFSHQMIRLLFVEQLYRAFTIVKGEKYHHD